MKKSLLLTSSVLAMTVFANSASADLANLHYKPSAGDIVSTTTYSMDTENTTSTETDSTSVTEVLEYGLSDQDTLSLTLKYKDSDADDGTGAYNPEIAFTRRHASESSYIDIEVSYQPDILDETDSDNGDDSATIGLGFSVGLENEFFDYELSVKTYEVGSTDSDASYNLRILGFEAQYEISEEINLNLELSSTEASASLNSGNLTYGASLDYALSSNLVASLGYEVKKASDN